MNRVQNGLAGETAAPSPAAPLPRISLHFRTWRVAILATDRHLLAGFADRPRFASSFDIDRGLVDPAEFASPAAAQAVIDELRDRGWRTELWPFEIAWAGESPKRLLRALARVRETATEAALVQLRQLGMSELGHGLAGLSARR